MDLDEIWYEIEESMVKWLEAQGWQYSDSEQCWMHESHGEYEDILDAVRIQRACPRWGVRF